MTEIREEGLLRFSKDNKKLDSNTNLRLNFKKFESYRKIDLLPTNEAEIKSLKSYLDRESDTVILLIFRYPTLFHLNTLKSISRSEENKFI